MGPMGVALKLGTGDARGAEERGVSGKGKNDMADNLVTTPWRTGYDALEAALAKAGNVEVEELATEATLARCTLLLSQGLYEALPAGAPRFPELPAMIARLLFVFVMDEANRLNSKAANAVWGPMVCEAAIGGRGRLPKRLLPGLHLLIAIFNPIGPLSDVVHAAGESLLTPRPVTVDAAGVRIRPPIELIVQDDGTNVWDARAVLPAMTTVSGPALQRRTDVVAALRKLDGAG